MSKVYLVGHSWDICDDDITVGVFLNKEKAEKYVNEHNIPRQEKEKQQKICQKCRKYNEYDNPEDDAFILSGECPLSKIETDRHGAYCEHDISDPYGGLSGTDYYYVSELDLLD